MKIIFVVCVMKPPKGRKSRKVASKSKKAAASGANKIQKFKPNPRNFGIGNAIQPKRRALGRMIKWPKYIRIQRQRKLLMQRLKIPPALNLFTQTADRSVAGTIFTLLEKYRPEDKASKRERRREQAKAKSEGREYKQAREIAVKFGLNHVTNLIETKKAKLVVIAHDVDPIELVIWLPTLCVKMDVPFAIVKGKSRLGKVVYQKTVTCLAITGVRQQDQGALDTLCQTVRGQFNDRFNDLKRVQGGGILGIKTRHRTAHEQRMLAREERKRAEM